MTLAYPDALNNDTVPPQVHAMRLQHTTASRALSNTCLYENDVAGLPDLRGLRDLKGLHFAASTVWARAVPGPSSVNLRIAKRWWFEYNVAG